MRQRWNKEILTKKIQVQLLNASLYYVLGLTHISFLIISKTWKVSFIIPTCENEAQINQQI